MTLDELSEATRVDIILFAELMDNPAKFDFDRQETTWDQLLRLHESFVLCQPNGQW